MGISSFKHGSPFVEGLWWREILPRYRLHFRFDVSVLLESNNRMNIATIEAHQDVLLFMFLELARKADMLSPSTIHLPTLT